MSEKPPPYPEKDLPRRPEASSRIAIPTFRAEKSMVFVRTTLEGRAALVHMDKEGLAFEKHKLFAYEKMPCHTSEKRIEIVPISFDSKTTFRSLVNEIMSYVLCKPNTDKAVEKKYKASPVRVSHIYVVWNGVDSPTCDNLWTVVYPSSQNSYLREVLEKMKARGWKDLLIVELRFES